MKHVLHSPFAGLIVTGLTASVALLLEPHLPVSQDIHFLLELLWLGIIASALLVCALLPAAKDVPSTRISGANAPLSITPELLDEDRAWLQAHPDETWNANEGKRND